MDKTTLDRLEVCAKKGAHVSREEFLSLIALARAGIAAPTGQQAEPVAIYQVRDKYIGAWCDVRAQDYELAQPEKRRILYVAPVSAAPAAPTAELKYTDAEMAQAHTQGYELGMKQKREALLSEVAPTAAEGPSDPVVEANRALLLERSRVGIRKYGVTLSDAGLSRAQLTQHALEEALDLANYLQTIIQTDAAMSAAQAQPKDTTDTKDKANG